MNTIKTAETETASMIPEWINGSYDSLTALATVMSMYGEAMSDEGTVALVWRDGAYWKLTVDLSAEVEREALAADVAACAYSANTCKRVLQLNGWYTPGQEMTAIDYRKAIMTCRLNLIKQAS